MRNIINQLNVLTYIRREHLTSEKMISHGHSSWEIIYCSKGKIEIQTYGKKNTSNFVHIGQFAIIKPNVQHCVFFKETSYLMVLEIKEEEENLIANFVKNDYVKETTPSFYKTYSKLNNINIFNDKNNVGKNIDEFITCFVKHKEDEHNLITKYEHHILLEKLLLNICKSSDDIVDKTSNKYINQCIYYINSHYTEDIKIKDIAETLKITPSYIERIFKKEYKMSIIDYIINQRLNYAIVLLKKTSLSYKTIAERSGFKTYVQLYKTFKKKYQCTIDEFKQSQDYVQFFHEDFHEI